MTYPNNLFRYVTFIIFPVNLINFDSYDKYFGHVSCVLMESNQMLFYFYKLLFEVIYKQWQFRDSYH